MKLTKKPRNSSSGPMRIVCLTEESVEWLYALGCEERVVGVSVYAVRPSMVSSKPKVSTFLDAKLDKILELHPDLVIGFSDIQKDLARELIGAGLNVLVTNQRSLEEIFATLLLFGRVVGKEAESLVLLEQYENKMDEARSFAGTLKSKPCVYIEEWDEPLITGIRWFSELVELCGGEVIFKERSSGSLAKDRFVTHEEIISLNPDIILASWCGKRVRIDKIKQRAGYEEINAVRTDWVRELAPEIFLQPGPALFVDGIDELMRLFREWNHARS
jgi:iron complex transport system substrate-binding protein